MMLSRFLLFSAAGWVVEALSNEAPRYSQVFRGLKIPLLPVYGAGGVLLGALRPELKNTAPVLRGFAYGLTFGGLEFVACHLDRALHPNPSWAYENGQCVTLRHMAAWGTLGLIAENLT